MQKLKILKFIKFVREIKKYHEESENNIFSKKSVLWDFILKFRLKLDKISDDELICLFDNFLNPESEQTSGVSGVKTKLTEELLRYYEEEIPRELVNELPEPNVGNPLKILIHDAYISSSYASNLMLFKSFTDIYNKIRKNEEWGDILEIGAGYGCLALNLIRTGRARSYTIIDLEENLLNSFYFLSKTTNYNIKILSNIKINKLEKKTIYLLSPGYINSLENIYFNVALNSDSLGEMPKNTASAYLTYIRKHLNNNGIFISKNGHLRSSVGVDRLQDYGFDQFKLIELRACHYSSSALDDFSHLIALQSVKKSQWTNHQIKYLDVIGDLIRCGLSKDIEQLISRYVCDKLNEKDIKLLETMILNFNGDCYQKTGNLTIDLFFDFMYAMTEVKSKKGSVESAIGYLKKGLSPHAKVYAYAYLYKLGIIKFKLVSMESAMIQYLCNLLFNEFTGITGYFKYKIRVQQLRKKIWPRKDRGNSIIITLKNIYMNLKERRGLSLKRGY